MSLIKDIDEVKEYLSVDISMNSKTIKPYLKPAEEHVIRLLGKEQFEELDDYYNYVEPEFPAWVDDIVEYTEGQIVSHEGTNYVALQTWIQPDRGPVPGESPDYWQEYTHTIEELDALLPYVQRPVVNFAFLLGLSMLNVSIGDNGIAVISNNNLTPASKQRTDDLKADLEAGAYDALESLLEHLEAHLDDYPLWATSDAYAYQYEYLITSARRFDELLRIDRSRLTFLNWRPTMADVEFLEIHPAVSKEFCEELKSEMKAGEVSESNQVVLPLLQKALAYLTAAIEIDKKYENRGRSFLMEAKRIMDTEPDNYPTYKSSSVYVATLTSYQKYENTEDSNFFVTG